MQPHSERGHVELSPSSAYRWLLCPGSVQLLRGVTRRVSSVYADEGTQAHEIAQNCILQNTEPSLVGVGSGMLGTLSLAHEDVEAISVYVDHCRALMSRAKWWTVEQRISLDSLNPPAPMDGTADFVCLTTEGVLHVCDLKYGKGVKVKAEGNKQLFFYALGAMVAAFDMGLNVASVVATIVQPRIAGEAVSSVEVDPLELIQYWTDELRPGALAALAPDAPLVPGEYQCRFCDARGTCTAAAQRSVQMAQREFFDVIPTSMLPVLGPTLSPEQLGELVGRLGEIEDWVKAVREAAHAELEAGRPVAGWKLVDKRAHRKWKDATAAVGWALSSAKSPIAVPNLYEPTELRSPAQIEKLVGAKAPEELTDAPVTGTTMVRSTDPRPEARRISAADEFAAITPANTQPTEPTPTNPDKPKRKRKTKNDTNNSTDGQPHTSNHSGSDTVIPSLI